MLKKRREEVIEGEFQTACSNACSNGATFGDVNVKESPAS
jgi:molybdopterin-containing oxidoreductase family iron-sulfur binding subunit